MASCKKQANYIGLSLCNFEMLKLFIEFFDTLPAYDLISTQGQICRRLDCSNQRLVKINKNFSGIFYRAKKSV